MLSFCLFVRHDFIQKALEVRSVEFLSGYLSITLWNGKVCENDFAEKALELRSGFDVVV